VHILRIRVLYKILENPSCTPNGDTHEFLVFVPFSIQGLGLLVYPFFCGLLDFYSLNLTHLNPNSVLQIATFVYLCEVYIGISPHFGL
jgi:hypothetical protein